MIEEDYLPHYEGLKILARILARIVLDNRSSQATALYPENLNQYKTVEAIDKTNKEVMPV